MISFARLTQAVQRTRGESGVAGCPSRTARRRCRVLAMRPATPPVLAALRACLVVGLGLTAGLALAAEPLTADHEFAEKLKPLLKEHCFKCHNPEKRKGDIDLTEFDSEGAMLKKFK